MTVIMGGKESWLFDISKDLGLDRETDKLFIQPEVFPFSFKAPSRRKKYHSVTLEVAFAPEIFTNPESYRQLHDMKFFVIATLPKSEASDLALELEEQSFRKPGHLEHYPRLEEIWNRFICDWTAEYDRLKEEWKEDVPENDPDQTV